MRLLELEPEWLVLTGQVGRHRRGGDVAADTAQGFMFLCPLCFKRNGGAAGTHSIVVWSRSRGVPDTEAPGPGRWTWSGTGFHDLTVLGDPPGNARSIDLSGSAGCGWHGFITNGEAC